MSPTGKAFVRLEPPACSTTALQASQQRFCKDWKDGFVELLQFSFLFGGSKVHEWNPMVFILGLFPEDLELSSVIIGDVFATRPAAWEFDGATRKRIHLIWVCHGTYDNPVLWDRAFP